MTWNTPVRNDEKIVVSIFSFFFILVERELKTAAALKGCDGSRKRNVKGKLSQLFSFFIRNLGRERERKIIEKMAVARQRLLHGVKVDGGGERERGKERGRKRK